MSWTHLLRWFAVDPALAASARPIDAIVEKLARTLDAECVFVGEVLETNAARARTVAWWKHGRHPKTVEYAATGSPYKAPMSRSISLVTHPLTSLDGVALGHIGIASRRGLKDERKLKRLLAACAPRIAGEVERLRRENRDHTRDVLGVAEARRREHQLFDSIRQAETVIRETHHRVKNNLQVVASLLTMQLTAASDEGVRSGLVDAVTRVSTIALIHAQLCDAPTLTLIDMQAFVRDLVGNVQRTFDSAAHVATSVTVDRFDLPVHLATPCGLLINELLTNAYKHAFVNTERGLVDIRLATDGRTVTVLVRDNGPGLPREDARHQGGGLGLQLIRLLVTKQLRGDISVISHGGTEVTARFPLDVVSPSHGHGLSDDFSHEQQDG